MALRAGPYTFSHVTYDPPSDVLLASLDGERATIEIGPRRVTLPSSEVERFWDGPFVLIWRSPVTGPVPLQPGMLGRDVAWLRQRLGALDGQPVTAKFNQTYDEELKRRVASFQQGEALVQHIPRAEPKLRAQHQCQAESETDQPKL